MDLLSGFHEHPILLPVLLIALFFLVSMVVLSFCNDFLPVWFCKHLGWHKAPSKRGFDGASFTGTCPRCGKHVLQDSQGNWF
jgi:hypothetical protein